jgi:hypothetical protein
METTCREPVPPSVAHRLAEKPLLLLDIVVTLALGMASTTMEHVRKSPEVHGLRVPIGSSTAARGASPQPPAPSA